MIACYCRVSTKQQSNNSQRSEILSWLARNGNASGEVRWFEDKDSGRSLKRPGFESLQAAILAGEVKMVVVWKLDRLSRQITEGINVLAAWCDQGIRIVSVTQQIDLAGPVGRMIAGVMFGLAEIEWDHRRERQAAGIRLAKQNGVYRGRKPGAFKAKPTRAKTLLENGLTPCEIATALGVSERTVFRYLKR